MRKVISIILLSLILTLSIFISGCKYSSSYFAIGFVRSADSKSGSMSFLSFEGRYIFKFKSDYDSCKIQYSSKLEDGKANIFIDADGQKTKLFSAESGSEIKSETMSLNKGIIYIIIETDGKCENGSFSFKLEQLR